MPPGFGSNGQQQQQNTFQQQDNVLYAQQSGNNGDGQQQQQQQAMGVSNMFNDNSANTSSWGAFEPNNFSHLNIMASYKNLFFGSEVIQ